MSGKQQNPLKKERKRKIQFCPSSNEKIYVEYRLKLPCGKRGCGKKTRVTGLILF